MKQNPWAGLASYQDPAAGSTLLFCGRDNESYDLAALVDDNIFCTLYGKSGTGKTSLLNAGVFPRLREMGYLPVSIRLGMEAIGTTFQQCIVNRLAQVAEMQTADTVALPADEQDEQWLWAWFARTRFVDGEGKTRFAVLVFDQFEEVFRSRRDEAEALLRQIHFMMDPSHSLGESYDYNFRFLASIREDDLYLLEDSLDRNFMGDMKQCRYRLNALSDEGARDVILKPGQGLFVEGEQDEIVNTIIGIARSADGSINTNILSLVCSRIYEEYRRNGAKSISLELVRGFVSSNPFEQFYNEVTATLGEKEKQFIEDRLVDAAGRRGSVSEPDFEKHVPNGAHLLEGTGRILQRVASGTEGRSYRIELIHDSFCAPLADQKLKRAARRRRRIITALSVLALVVVAIAAYIIIMSVRNARQTREILIQQERFYAYRASQLLDEGDTYTALLLLNELTDPDGPFAKVPFQPEAERQMRRAIQMNDTAEWQVECAYQLDRGYFTETPQVTPDGKYLVESTVKALLFYDFHTGQLVKRIHTTPAADYSPCFSISHDGKTVFSFNTEEWRYYSLGANIINVESWENKVLNFRKCNDVDCDYLSDYSHGYAVFSNDDKWLFYLRDTISRTSFNRYDVLKAFSLIDSTEYSFQNGDDIMFLENGNYYGSRLAAYKNNGEMLIYNKASRELISSFNPGDFDICKYVNDDVLLFVKKDGLYKYSIPQKKFDKISDRYYDCELFAEPDIQVAMDCFGLSQDDTVFIYDIHTFDLRDIYLFDKTRYADATLYNGGKIFLCTKDHKRYLLASHNLRKPPQKVELDYSEDNYFINDGQYLICIKTLPEYSNNFSIFQIKEVNTNNLLFSDTAKYERNIVSISPNERYLIAKEYTTFIDPDGSVLRNDSNDVHKLFDLKKMIWIDSFGDSKSRSGMFFTNEDNCFIFFADHDIYHPILYNIDTKKSGLLFKSKKDSLFMLNYGIVTNPKTRVMVATDRTNGNTHFINSKTRKMRKVSDEGYTDVVFTPNGKLLISLAGDGTVRLHNASNFNVIDSCSSFISRIKAIHPNGTQFVAKTNTGNLELWSVSPLKKLIENFGDDLYVIENLSSWVKCSFCDNGKNVVFYSANPDGFIKIPILSQQDVIERAREAVGSRKLTDEEKSLLME